MKLISKILLVCLVTVATNAFADTVVSCKDAKVKNGPQIFSFVFAGTPSARLLSSITYQNQTYTAAQVAQYAANKNVLFVLVDNAAGLPVLSFEAKPYSSTFSGTATSFKANGKPDMAKALKCTLVAL